MSNEHSQGQQLPTSGTLSLQRGPDTNADSIERVSLSSRRGNRYGTPAELRSSAGVPEPHPIFRPFQALQ